MNTNDNSKLYPSLTNETTHLLRNRNKIPKERKLSIKEIAKYVAKKLQNRNDVSLIFICTRNSRCSHIAYLWTLAISNYFGIARINCYSGGTEANAFNYRSVSALKKCIFEIEQIEESFNSKYLCKIGND